MVTPMTQRRFGVTAHGEEVNAFILTQRDGVSAEFIEFGASLSSLKVNVADGLREVTLGCDTMADYEAQAAYLGAVVGRCANRTAHGHLLLDGERHQLDVNHGPHHLHGGAMGMGRQLWIGELRDDARGPSVRFTRTSPAGEGGYPGTLQITVDYTLDATSRLWMEFRALTDATTAVNLSNHAYFNLGGPGCLDCRAHRVVVAADRVMETDAARLPTGRLLSVAGTPLDFRRPQLLGEVLDEVHPLIAQGQGCDHTLLFEDPTAGLREVAQVTSPDGHLRMHMWTDQPSLQLYTGNFMAGTPGRGGVAYGANAGVCLEAQKLPDATKHVGFPSIVLRPSEVYRQTTAYGFTQSGRMPPEWSSPAVGAG